MSWTQFMDMSSGGSQKLAWRYIYIEAPKKEAEIIFYNKFGRNPRRVTCDCCGEDYSATEADTFAKVTAFNRGCAFKAGEGYIEEATTMYKYQTVLECMNNPKIKIIWAVDLEDEDRKGVLPEEGYVGQGED